MYFTDNRPAYPKWKACYCSESSVANDDELFNKRTFCDNSEINTLISKRLSVENKAKLSVSNSKHLCSIVCLQFTVKKVSLYCLQMIALKSVYKFGYCCKICPCLWHSALEIEAYGILQGLLQGQRGIHQTNFSI